MIQKLQKPINFYVRGVKFASLINILILLFACNNAQQEGSSSSGKDYIRICSNDYFILQYNGKYGLLSKKLDTILDFQYSDIKLVPGTKDVFVTEKLSKNGAVLYECGIYANGKHIVMQDVSSFLWM